MEGYLRICWVFLIKQRQWNYFFSKSLQESQQGEFTAAGLSKVYGIAAVLLWAYAVELIAWMEERFLCI